MQLLLDKIKYTSKPQKDDITKISTRIVNCITEVHNLYDIAVEIGEKGRTWCPAIFNGSRSNKNFKEIQFIALDFDDGSDFNSIMDTAKEYMLPIIFAYETFSSVSCNRFRIVFKLETAITDINVFNIIIAMLMQIFRSCDKSCKDVARLFFGGKKLIYFDNKERPITLSNLHMNFIKYMKDRYDSSHYMTHLREFAAKNNIGYDKGRIQPFGEILQNASLYINTDCKKSPNFKIEEKDILEKIPCYCQLFNEFISDSQWLYYSQLFGLALNLIHIKTGKNFCLDIINKSQYDTYKRDWKFYLSYFKKYNYLPMKCDNFCPYCDSCCHDKNILSTTHLKQHHILRTSNPEYVSSNEAYSDLRSHFNTAMNAADNRIHVIQAQTAIGKTHMYIEFLKKCSSPCIIAVPTNILKHEVYEKCLAENIDVYMTPSIEEIKNDIPAHVYSYIQKLYDSGRHNSVLSYIKSVLKSESLPVLEKFIEDKERMKDFKGHIITTHHRVLYSQKSFLEKYQVIIDEDILKTIVLNQGYVDTEDIENALNSNLPDKVMEKLDFIYTKSQQNEYFEYFEYPKVSVKNKFSADFDIQALLKTEHFCSDGNKVYFCKTPNLLNVKYVVLSATASEYVYKKIFRRE